MAGSGQKIERRWARGIGAGRIAPPRHALASCLAAIQESMDDSVRRALNYASFD